MYVASVDCVGDWLVGWLFELEFSVLSRSSNLSFINALITWHVHGPVLAITYIEEKTIAYAHPIQGRRDEREEQQHNNSRWKSGDAAVSC